MIKINLAVLLAKQKEKQKDLAIKENIRPNTVSDLYHEKVRAVDLDTLNKICKHFNCSVADVLEYVPDKE